MVAALAQGIALGALLQGIPVEGGAYAGGWWDWLTPFSLLVGARARRRLRAAGRHLAGDADRGRAPGFGPAAARLASASAPLRPSRRSARRRRSWRASTATLVRDAERAAHGPGAAPRRARRRCCSAAARDGRGADAVPARARRCSCCRSSGSASASSPTSCRAGHDLGGGGTGISQVFLLVGASVLIPMILAYTAYPTGSSAARSTRTATIDGPCRPPGRSGDASPGSRRSGSSIVGLGFVATVLRLWLKS